MHWLSHVGVPTGTQHGHCLHQSRPGQSSAESWQEQLPRQGAFRDTTHPQDRSKNHPMPLLTPSPVQYPSGNGRQAVWSTRDSYHFQFRVSLTGRWGLTWANVWKRPEFLKDEAKSYKPCCKSRNTTSCTASLQIIANRPLNPFPHDGLKKFPRSPRVRL